MPTCPICLAPLTPRGKCTFCRYDARRRGFIRTWVLPTFGIAVLFLGIGYYAVNYFTPAVSGMFKEFESARSASGNYAASMPPPEQTYDPQEYDRLEVEEVRELRALFDARRFEELNARIDDYQTRLEQGPEHEDPLLRAFATFALPDPDLLPAFDHWAEATPDHYAPYQARAEHAMAMAAFSRGTAYASETSQEQFDGMHHYLRRCEDDLAAALQRNPRLLPAYLCSIRLHNLEGNDAQEDEAFTTARVYYPASFALYNRMLAARLPRWGGSYCQMDKLSREASDQGEVNPKLATLFGVIYADRAWYARRDKNYQEALDIYSEGLTYGESAYLYRERAKTYMYMQDYVNAGADIERSLELDPTSLRTREEASRIVYRLGNLDGSLEHIYLATLMAPEDDDLHSLQVWALKVIGGSTHPEKNDMQRVLTDALQRHG